ncbi:dsDNA nuclease domain-containing protein [Pseudobacillus wudalianchiensis]|uniref:CD-NTase associated protein 4-like DNA endonuclease domain-containing protein n=1 Tax=Pseudobacillus wudalianchiensis TaxID=1743143 RepID=A0A1B9AN44_9BACI|nr:dsDNA nuclease domain-containing protein [Bacillus wudalianchiensis]OCA85262.1 hypothetical protein A8F95_11365 [Bacillus wudalianchiensis]
MVIKLTSSALREKAGSESYNRFEYQVHWIVYHMINEFMKGSEFYIFCEFHDDMAKTEHSMEPSCADFYQIKTTSQFKEWTFPRLFRTYKKRDGGTKHSFLGFIFYNFLNFQSECSACHFVSNVGMNEEVRRWQACVEDKKELEKEEPELYIKIKSFILNEFEEVENFDEVFDKFVQNTFLYNGDLSLDNYEKVVAGEFFEMLRDTDIFASNSNKILRDIIENVRRKSKQTIEIPISYKSLQEKKGISSEVFSKLKSQVGQGSRVDEKNYTLIKEFLSNHNIPDIKINILISRLKAHYMKELDVSDLLYQDSIESINLLINDLIIEHYDEIDDSQLFLSNVKGELIDKTREIVKKDIGIDIILVEVLFYEKLVI